MVVPSFSSIRLATLPSKAVMNLATSSVSLIRKWNRLSTRKEKVYWIGGLLHRFSSSDNAELTEHSGSTDYARILNGWSTCSVFEKSPTDFHRFSGWRVVKSGEEWSTALHTCKLLSYRYLCHFREEWRVFLKLYGQSFSGKVLEIRR